MCEDHLEICPKDSVAYRATLIEKGFYDAAIKALEQEIVHNLCDSCTNIGCEFQSGIVRKECAFYMPPHIEPDNCGNYVVQESNTKNDLAVDCISREKALGVIRNLYPSMPKVDFNGSLRKWGDKYKPYIECEDAIKELPPVTPIRPKGHWIETAEEYYKAINEKGGGVNENTDYFVDDIACSECLAKFSVIDNEAERFDFCPCCGSDNR